MEGTLPVRAFVITGPRASARCVDVPPPVAGARRGRGRRRAGRRVRHRRRVLHRRDGVPALGRRRVPDADRARVVRRGRGGRRRGRPVVARPAGHRRHDARLRRVRAVPGGRQHLCATALRDRHPGRLAGRARRAAAGSGARAACRCRPLSTPTVGALVEPGGNALRAVPRPAGVAAGERLLVVGPGTIGLLVALIARSAGRRRAPARGGAGVAGVRPVARLRLGVDSVRRAAAAGFDAVVDASTGAEVPALALSTWSSPAGGSSTSDCRARRA